MINKCRPYYMRIFSSSILLKQLGSYLSQIKTDH